MVLIDIEQLPYRSIPQMLRENAQKHQDLPAISYKKGGAYLTLSYQQFYTRVLMVARGLRKMGMEPGDRVAIFSANRAGWVLADMGIQCSRGASVPIYATNTGVQAAYIINQSGAKIIFISDRSQYEKLLAVRDQIPSIELVISFERFLGEPDLPVYTLYQLSEISHPIESAERNLIEAEIATLAPTDVLTIMYTSGTTGAPKGAILTHRNLLMNAWIASRYARKLDVSGTVLSFLPLSHVLERMAGYYLIIMNGGNIVFAEDVLSAVTNSVEVKPTAMISVPRMFEKIHSRIYETVHCQGVLRRSLFHAAIEVGRKYLYRQQDEVPLDNWLRIQHKFFDTLVFRKIRGRFGGRVKFFISGGAPLDKTINEFMWIIGLPVFEGYGLTETSPVIALNVPDENRFGSVGKPIPETEIKLAPDGELLVKGPQVSQGYYNDPIETTAAFVDGWFKTGDIAEIDSDGYLYIIDRKKELIVTAGGKNIAPQLLENELKLDKYISHAYVYGDKRPYLVALLTPNLERLIEFAQGQKIDYLSIEDLVVTPQVQRLYAERVARFNQKHSAYETIKNFELLAREFTAVAGELTPTLKLKRKNINEIYSSNIEQLYSMNNNPHR